MPTADDPRPPLTAASPRAAHDVTATTDAAVGVASDAEALRVLAGTLAREAGALLRSYLGKRLTVETKTSTTDPVSEADRAAEALVVDGLRLARPDDGLVGEEATGDATGTSGITWLVDPLDGTVNYLYGNPHWGVSIAAVGDDGLPVAAAVYGAAADELFTAARGGGAVRHVGDGPAVPLAVNDPDDLAHALVATGFAYDRALRTGWAAHVADLLGHVRDVRRAGVASLDLAWVAAGRVDAYLEFALQPWDWAAGHLLVTEAGGHVTRPRLALGGDEQAGLLAAGPATHGRLADWLAGRRRARA